MTSAARLDGLPEELIIHIATRSDALSALRLSTTCRAIRSATYNSQTFRGILYSSQLSYWPKQSLHLDAIKSQAGKDAGIWARYALADQYACELAKKECPLETPENFLRWLPQLITTRHPFMYHQCWARFLRNGPAQSAMQVFCQATAILAAGPDVPMAQLSRSLRMQEDTVLSSERYPTHVTYLWVLCDIALNIRAGVHTRQTAWPFNAAAQVPYMNPPTASQIPLHDSMPAPMPFSVPGAWDAWYGKYNQTLLDDPEYITQGMWCGYYTGFGNQARWLDPPMLNIRFRVVPMQHEGVEVRTFRADGCHDGIGSFTIDGGFQTNNKNGEVEFMGNKSYTNSHVEWLWVLRFTPFGLVGYWGKPGHDDDRELITRMGLLWLWKKEWAEGSSAMETRQDVP